jgi:hypothetical protein
MEEQAIGLSGSGQATCECWGPVGQAILGCNFGKNPKYRKSVQQRCAREEGRMRECATEVHPGGQ